MGPALGQQGVNIELLATSGHEYEYLGGEHYLAQAPAPGAGQQSWPGQTVRTPGPGAVWPAQRLDVAAAVDFVKRHAAEWGVDGSRIVIFGRSAGGQIAEASAYALHDPDVRGVVALYAPSDMNFAWKWSRPDDALNSPELMRRFLGGTPETARAAYDDSSAILHVDAQSPPTLLVHGTIDTLVWHRHSVRLAARLSEVGVPNLLVSLPWATHALELNPGSPSGQLTLYSVEWFLAAVCR